MKIVDASGQTFQEIDQLAADLETPSPQPRPRLVRENQPKANRKQSDAPPLDDDSSETTRPRSRARTSSGKSLPPSDVFEELQDDLQGIFTLGGGLFGMVLPVTGMTMVLRAEKGSQAITDLARSNPKLLAWLLKWVVAGKYAMLGEVVADVALGATVDIGIINPSKPSLGAMMVAKNIGDVLEHFTVEESADREYTAQNGSGPPMASTVPGTGPPDWFTGPPESWSKN